jgi:hypothetical protein
VLTSNTTGAKGKDGKRRWWWLIDFPWFLGCRSLQDVARISGRLFPVTRCHQSVTSLSPTSSNFQTFVGPEEHRGSHRLREFCGPWRPCGTSASGLGMTYIYIINYNYSCIYIYIMYRILYIYIYQA